MTSECPTPERLIEFLTGSEVNEEVCPHLRECLHCSTALAKIRGALHLGAVLLDEARPFDAAETMTAEAMDSIFGRLSLAPGHGQETGRFVGGLRLRVVAWTAVSGLAAALLLGLFVWWPNAPPAPAASLTVYRCGLDQTGKVLTREPVSSREVMRTGDAFQVGFTSELGKSYLLLHVDAYGEIKPLHERKANTAQGAEKIVLPAPDQAYRLDANTGIESFLLVETDSPQALLASAERMMGERTSQNVVRGVGSKLSGLDVNEFVSRLKNAYDVKSTVVIDHRPE